MGERLAEFEKRRKQVLNVASAVQGLTLESLRHARRFK